MVLYFDHSYPPDRGYAYVGASRVRTANDCYHFGLIRRTDWLPVGGDESTEQLQRSADSMSDSEDSDGESRDSSLNFENASESNHSHDELFSELMQHSITAEACESDDLFDGF